MIISSMGGCSSCRELGWIIPILHGVQPSCLTPILAKVLLYTSEHDALLLKSGCGDPPGSRRVLPLSSPLRTGREGFPSSGSSPWPLLPVLLMTLPMAPGVYQTFIVDVVRSTLTCKDNVGKYLLTPSRLRNAIGLAHS